jgi:hypothetical protein
MAGHPNCFGIMHIGICRADLLRFSMLTTNSATLHPTTSKSTSAGSTLDHRGFSAVYPE